MGIPTPRSTHTRLLLNGEFVGIFALIEYLDGRFTWHNFDNGKGISDEDKDKVFEPKFTTKTSGMGLGLPMIKNIIEAYGGTLYFESQKNIATIFTVQLPKE